MIVQETISRIALLMPSVALFRSAQLAHAALRTTPAEQFMVRCRYRQLRHTSTDAGTVTDWILPSGREDGLSLGQFDTEYMYIFYKNGRNHGKSLTYDISGQLLELFTYADGVLHGDCKVWHSLNGQLLEHHTFVNGMLHGDQLRWRANGTVLFSYRSDVD